MIDVGRPSIFSHHCWRMALCWCGSKVWYGNYHFSTFWKPSSSKHTQVPLRDLGLGFTPNHFSLSWNLLASAETFWGETEKGRVKKKIKPFILSKGLGGESHFPVKQNQQVSAGMLVWGPGCLVTMHNIYSTICRFCCWTMSMDRLKPSSRFRKNTLGILQPFPFLRAGHCCLL